MKQYETNKSILGLIVIVAMIGAIVPQTAVANSPLLVRDSVTQSPLGLHLDYFEDKTTTLKIADILQPEIADKFVSSTVETPNFGLGLSSAYWFSFELQNTENIPINRLLEIGYPLLDDIHLYFISPTSPRNHLHLGDKLSFSERPIDHRNFVIPIELKAKESLRVLMRVQTDGSMRIPLSLWKPQQFFEQDARSISMQALFFGLLLAMALYNLFIYFSLRERSYLYYVGFVCSTVGFVAGLNGISYQFLWPNAEWWSGKSLLFFIGLAEVCAGLFAIEFLDLRTHFKKHSQYLLLMTCLAGIATFLTFVWPYWLMARVLVILIILEIPACFSAGVCRWRQEGTEAVYYVAAWASFLVGTFTNALTMFGILPASLLTNNGPQIGATILVTLLSLGLARKLKAINDISLQIQQNTATLLQEKVDERTYELKQKTLEAQDATQKALRAITDSDEARARVEETNLKLLAKKATATAARFESDQLRSEAEKHAEEADRLRDEAEKHAEEADQLRNEAEKHAHELEDLNQQKTIFFQNISHELRTPLTLILNPLEEVAAEQPKENRLNIAAKNSRRLLRLVNQLLDFQKLEAGKQDLKLTPVNITRFAHICGNYFASACSAKNVEFLATLNGVEMDDDSPSVHILGEVDALEKVTFNFLSNALKFTPEGGQIELGLSTTSDTARIFIRDTGPGISDADRQRLFQAFTQLDATTTRNYEGTGLGLAFVKSLVEEMGGKVGIDSQVGKGSTFWADLPLIDAPPAGVIDVLLVDDEEPTLRNLAIVLQRCDSVKTCEIALSASEARDYLKNNRVKCVVSDETMPGEGGVELLTFVAESQPKCRRVLATGLTGPDLLSKAINDARVDHVFTKPFEIEEFRIVVDGLVRTSTVYEETLFEGDDFEVKDWVLDDSQGETGLEDTGVYQALEHVNDGSGELILVVDDLPDMRDLIASALKKKNYRVATAPNGQRGLEIAKEIKPNLIITDWMMPVMSGPDLIHEIRHGYHGLLSTPVILLTAKSDEESKLIGTDIGADAFLGKPFSAHELGSIVRNLLSLKASETEIETARAFLEQLILSMANPLLVLDDDRKIIQANPAAYAYFAFPEKEIMGMRGVALLAEKEPLRIVGLNCLFADGQSMSRMNVHVQSKQNEYAVASLTASRMEEGYLLEFNDITELHDAINLADAAALEAQNKAAALSEANSEIVDLNNYITESVLKRYLPAGLIGDILRGDFEFETKPKRQLVTVLFSDLCGFTKLGEELSADDYANQLNEYLTLMNDLIFANSGTVDKFMGDGIMVLFGAPVEMEPFVQSTRAVSCARSMRNGLEDLNKKWRAKGLPELSARIGIHQGEALVGNFGSDKRSDYTCIGANVNMASRIEGVCEATQILVSETIALQVPDDVESAGKFELKGIEERQTLYKVVLS